MTPASGDSYIARAHALIDLGRQADAIPLLQRATAADPEDAYPRCILAARFLDLDRDEEACRTVENAIALDPELSLALGRVDSLMNRYPGGTRLASLPA